LSRTTTTDSPAELGPDRHSVVGFLYCCESAAV
jgi:hypothetical protein